MTASVGSAPPRLAVDPTLKLQLLDSVERLTAWLEKNRYRGYDTFDGLNARFARPFTGRSRFLRTALQQGVRRFPLNLRPLLGVSRSTSTKGMGFIARGFLRLYEANGDKRWLPQATMALDFLRQHRSPGYSGACWGNHFDYQSRCFYLPAGVPTVVWTSLIGHAFLDAFELFDREEDRAIAVSACEHILRDLALLEHGQSACISYIPIAPVEVHNANTLGASLLARTYLHTRHEPYRELAERAIRYTAEGQLPNGAWYYGEAPELHWIDNFHTAYVLDCFKHYSTSTGDDQFDGHLQRGYEYWKETFFLDDGTPRYYHHKTMPIDIQCCSQAIDTLVFFQDRDPDALALAARVARWTIDNMQDASGYFYYRRYSPWLVNRTPTLHWGQATMLCALAGLLRSFETSSALA